MRFPVPQFIEIEDKIIGPLSWRQFGELAFAGAISFISYFLFVKWVWFLISVICFSVAFLLAFWRPYGLRADQIVFWAIKHFTRPRFYFWQAPEKKIEIEIEEFSFLEKRKEKKEEKRPLKIEKEDFEKLAKILDER